MKKYFLFIALFVLSASLHAQYKTIVYFNTNQSALDKASTAKIDSIVKFLKSKDSYTIAISGYADNVGSNDINVPLSMQRAVAVLTHLTEHGIPSQYLTAKGYGSESPLTNNQSEQARMRNRRAELLLTYSAPIPSKPAPVAQPAPMPTLPPKVKMQEAEALTEQNSTNGFEVGQVLRLANLNFIGGTDNLLPEAAAPLALLLRTMKENPKLQIEIGGHVCCMDDMPLSIKRAEAVKDYLIRKGIEAERMEAKGYSRNKPIVPDDRNERDAKTNRRVEITILKN